VKSGLSSAKADPEKAKVIKIMKIAAYFIRCLLVEK
jgi:hypothetical protein